MNDCDDFFRVNVVCYKLRSTLHHVCHYLISQSPGNEEPILQSELHDLAIDRLICRYKTQDSFSEFAPIKYNTNHHLTGHCRANVYIDGERCASVKKYEYTKFADSINVGKHQISFI